MEISDKSLEKLKRKTIEDKSDEKINRPSHRKKSNYENEKNKILNSKIDIEESKEESKNNCLRCLNCLTIPLLFLNHSTHTIKLNCNAGHNISIDVKDYLEKGYANNFYNQICSQCKTKINVSTERKNYYCKECNEIFCRTCIKNHNIIFNNNNENQNLVHHYINLDKLDTTCVLHNETYDYYCLECNKNICQYCYYSQHKVHRIVDLDDIILRRKELKRIKDNFNLERDNLNLAAQLIKKLIIKIKREVNKILEYKDAELRFKESIIKIYEKKVDNYNTIKNIKNLLFNTSQFNIDKNSSYIDQLNYFYDYINKDLSKLNQDILAKSYSSIKSRLSNSNTNISNNNSKDKVKTNCNTKFNKSIYDEKSEFHNKINFFKPQSHSKNKVKSYDKFKHKKKKVEKKDGRNYELVNHKKRNTMQINNPELLLDNHLNKLVVNKNLKSIKKISKINNIRDITIENKNITNNSFLNSNDENEFNNSKNKNLASPKNEINEYNNNKIKLKKYNISEEDKEKFISTITLSSERDNNINNNDEEFKSSNNIEELKISNNADELKISTNTIEIKASCNTEELKISNLEDNTKVENEKNNTVNKVENEKSDANITKPKKSKKIIKKKTKKIKKKIVKEENDSESSSKFPSNRKLKTINNNTSNKSQINLSKNIEKEIFKVKENDIEKEKEKEKKREKEIEKKEEIEKEKEKEKEKKGEKQIEKEKEIQNEIEKENENQKEKKKGKEKEAEKERENEKEAEKEREIEKEKEIEKDNYNKNVNEKDKENDNIHKENLNLYSKKIHLNMNNKDKNEIKKKPFKSKIFNKMSMEINKKEEPNKTQNQIQNKFDNKENIEIKIDNEVLENKEVTKENKEVSKENKEVSNENKEIIENNKLVENKEIVINKEIVENKENKENENKNENKENQDKKDIKDNKDIIDNSGKKINIRPINTKLPKNNSKVLEKNFQNMLNFNKKTEKKKNFDLFGIHRHKKIHNRSSSKNLSNNFKMNHSVAEYYSYFNLNESIKEDKKRIQQIYRDPSFEKKRGSLLNNSASNLNNASFSFGSSRRLKIFNFMGQKINKELPIENNENNNNLNIKNNDNTKDHKNNIHKKNNYDSSKKIFNNKNNINNIIKKESNNNSNKIESINNTNQNELNNNSKKDSINNNNKKDSINNNNKKDSINNNDNNSNNGKNNNNNNSNENEKNELLNNLNDNEINKIEDINKITEEESNINQSSIIKNDIPLNNNKNENENNNDILNSNKNININEITPPPEDKEIYLSDGITLNEFKQKTLRLTVKEYENTVYSLLEINSSIFAVGFLNGEIDIYDTNDIICLFSITEHISRINNMFLLKEPNTFLSASFDYTMRKIKIIEDKKTYIVEFIFDGYDNIIYKGIELFSGHILSISFGGIISIWNKLTSKAYVRCQKNLIEEEELFDVIEINNKLIAISTDENLYFFNINTNKNEFLTQNKLIPDLDFKDRNNMILLNNNIMGILLKNEIGLVDITHKQVIHKCNIYGGKPETITLMRDKTILISVSNYNIKDYDEVEEKNNLNNINKILFMQYELVNNGFSFLLQKEEVSDKINSKDYCRITSVIEFNNGIIAFSTSGMEDNKMCGTISAFDY